MYFKYDNYDIHYKVYGDGQPLLILNGIMMSTESWSEFIEPFTKNNQLILLDFLGQGKSSIEKTQFYHDKQVEIVNALLEHLKIDKVNLFGISYGGEIALQFTLKYKNKVNKLILSNTCPNTSYWLQEIGNSWVNASKDALTYYLTTIPYIYSPKFFINNEEWISKRKALLLQVFNNKQWIESMNVLTNSSVGYDVRDRLHEIDVPTLILSCEYDFITPHYQQEELNEGIKNSQLLFIRDSGHAIMYEKPLLFISSVLGFVNNDKYDFSI